MNLPNVITAGVLFIAIAAGFFYFKKSDAEKAGVPIVQKTQADDLQPSLSEWIKKNVPDPEASAAEVSAPWSKNGKSYANFKLRGRNKLGGWVFQDMVAEVHGSKVIAAWDAGAFNAQNP